MSRGEIWESKLAEMSSEVIERKLKLRRIADWKALLAREEPERRAQAPREERPEDEPAPATSAPAAERSPDAAAPPDVRGFRASTVRTSRAIPACADHRCPRDPRRRRGHAGGVASLAAGA